VGTFIGVAGAIPPLVVSAAPFFAIIVYNALSEVNKDKVEMLRSLGVKGSKIILLLLKESLSPLIRGLTITLVTLIGFIAMAGIVGAGGLGQYAQLAYQSFKTD
jgi:D-methionine transport system permease protein